MYACTYIHIYICTTALVCMHSCRRSARLASKRPSVSSSVSSTSDVSIVSSISDTAECTDVETRVSEGEGMRGREGGRERE